MGGKRGRVMVRKRGGYGWEKGRVMVGKEGGIRLGKGEGYGGWLWLGKEVGEGRVKGGKKWEGKGWVMGVKRGRAMVGKREGL